MDPTLTSVGLLLFLLRAHHEQRQITIPQQVRRELGLEPGDEVEVVVQDGKATIVPTNGPSGKGDRLVAALLGKRENSLTTDQIMAMTRGE